MAVAGLILAALCTGVLFLLADWHPGGGESAMTALVVLTVFLDLGVLVGLGVMVVGLVLAGLLALAQPNRRS